MIKANLHIVDTFDEFKRLMSYESKLSSDIMVLDVETDSAIEKTANLYGIGLCFNEHKSFYIPFRTAKFAPLTSDPEIEVKKVWDFIEDLSIKKWLKKVASNRKLIGHNIIFDVLVLEKEDVYLADDIYSDTILQKHTLNEEKPFALKEIAVKYLGSWADMAQEQLKAEVLAKGGKWTKDQKDMYLASTDTLANYCSWDVQLTLQLFNKFEAQLQVVQQVTELLILYPILLSTLSKPL